MDQPPPEIILRIYGTIQALQFRTVDYNTVLHDAVEEISNSAPFHETHKTCTMIHITVRSKLIYGTIWIGENNFGRGVIQLFGQKLNDSTPKIVCPRTIWLFRVEGIVANPYNIQLFVQFVPVW